jgi:hypothetical protein
VLGVGIAVAIVDGVQLYGGYQLELRANETVNFVTLSVRLAPLGSSTISPA